MTNFARKFFAMCCGVVAVSISASAAPQQSPLISPISASGLKKEIAARKGRVVIVNFWATWCPPCKAEFPALVQLQKKYAAKGVSVLFVSADSTRSVEKTVRPFLKQMKLIYPTRIIAGNAINFVKAFDPALKDEFGLPRFYIYNRSGKLVKAFANTEVKDDTSANLRHFESIIKPLL